jgi:hypothetical protein
MAAIDSPNPTDPYNPGAPWQPLRKRVPPAETPPGQDPLASTPYVPPPLTGGPPGQAPQPPQSSTPPPAPGPRNPVPGQTTIATPTAGSYTGSDPLQALNAFLAANPGNPQAAIDAFNNSQYKASGLGPAWYPATQTIGLSNGTYLVMPGTGGNSGTTWATVQRGPEGVPGGSGLGTPGNLSPQDQALRDALIKQLTMEATQSLDINPLTDPTIQMETAPYAAEQTRMARNLQSQAAEAGGPNANISAQNALIEENAAQSTGAYSAGLVANELTARRDQISQALSSMQGILTAEETNQLQAELGQLNAAVSLQEAQAAASNQLQQAIFNNNYNLWYESRVNQGLPTS